MAVFAPMPSASDRMATAETTGAPLSERVPYRTSWMRRSTALQPQASRVVSRIRTTLPKSRIAAARASSAEGRRLSRCFGLLLEMKPDLFVEVGLPSDSSAAMP